MYRPESSGKPLFQHLLVAIDHRAGSYRAAGLGLRVAFRLRAQVTVVFVVAATAQDDSLDPRPHSHHAVDVGERVFRQIRRMALRAGVQCVCRYAFGRDAHAIVREAAAANHCDLIVFNGP